ncbi:E3 ubiquitin-protein ligase AIRP2 [Senna tora]|uniref:E3 ubiquitin-protein ligase AIRP2 n=1 Tax=Senna tora TaxID=362788 RepID=A0A834SFD6_9FABA|nr:E3 ubiquitin-protein ligase AIRP2 [Senna tora]
MAWEERGLCLNIFWTRIRGRISETLTTYEAKDLLRNGFDAPVAVVMAWEERGSCLNIFLMANHGRISETFTNYEAKDLLRKSVDHVLTYSGRQIAVGSQKPSRITMQKTCCASESNTSVRVVFVNRSGFDGPIAVNMAWEERGSSINIFRMKNGGRISETFTNYEAKDLLRKQKTCCARETNTLVRVVFANRSGFDAPIGVVLAFEERGSCLDKFRTTSRVNMERDERGSSINIFRIENRGRISDTFTNCEAKDLLRIVDHVLTNSGRKIAVGSQKPSRIKIQKTCCASESNTSGRVVFANRSGFDAPIAVNMEWDELILARVERGSCLNLFRMKNHGRMSETFMNYEAKVLLRNESITSVLVVFANRSGFDAPIGVLLAWEERGSCLNIFWTTNGCQISETFTNYEAKDLLRKNLHKLRGKRLDEEHDMASTRGWKTNTLKDPLQGIGGPMTRARTKAMKEALNCFIRDLKELEPNYIKESTINMSSKSPRKVVTMLKAQHDDLQGLCGVHMEELT